MTLYVHYKVLIEEYFENFGEDIVIAFVKDLKKLQDVENNNNNAKILAYEIGSLLPEVFINHLYYVKNKETPDLGSWVNIFLQITLFYLK